MPGISKTVYRGGEGEITEKKSRFIAEIFRVRTEEEALARIGEVRKKYWDARHHCYAYIIGDRMELVRQSDDGEPQGTAGRPILSVLQGAGITNVLAIVTRYFGGVLLGTGGLVRAYSQAAAAGLSNSVILEKRRGIRLSVQTDYADLGRLQYELAGHNIPVLGTTYEAAVRMELIVPTEDAEGAEKLLADVTGGRASVVRGNSCFFAVWDGRVLTEDI